MPKQTTGSVRVTLLSARWGPVAEEYVFGDNTIGLLATVRVTVIRGEVRSIANQLCFAPQVEAKMAWRGRELDQPLRKGQSREATYTLTPLTLGAGDLRWADCAFRDSYNESEFGWSIPAP
ncbi:hypothetical protein OG394_17605 [Kribbella sp. NBC_01245]|uniref:hypothetical protein n=1 Tax=Kribbella sp. NBC_01245 TaxID=2903578 RepID=UPI002E2E88A0|nr:hypothetical protein [Kribbella sp. NBC_01245]